LASEFKDAFENSTVTVDVPEFPPDIAVIVTVPGGGGLSGAVYSPQLVAPFVIVPEFADKFDVTDQVVEAQPAADVNCCVAPAGTATAAGLTATGCVATTLIVI
jgi:hypothetical protein